MRLKLMLILAVSAFFCSVFAFPVGKSSAESAAKNWLGSKSENKNYSVSEYINIEDALHVFNFEKGGFVIVAADDASKPVLGYSLTGHFDNSKEKTNTSFWIGLYVRDIKEIRTNKLSNEETLKEWNTVLTGKIVKNDTKAVLPLLTSTWNQSPIYNMYCPLDGGSLSVVGCVATAMSQIMYYHKFPNTGKGSSSYEILDQTLSAKYYLTKYNWDIMPNALSGSSSDSEKHEVAQISYHAGISVEMGYGADGSGAYSEDVPYALMNYFKYSSAIHNYRTSYNATSWRNMLQDQLNRSLPVYYAGQGPSGGHAFVCDGYQDTNFYHFNWGWGGSANGYFSIDNLNPGSSTFNSNQAVVKEIIPRTNNLSIVQPIGDFQTGDSTFQIVLSNYFSSLNGDSISYSIDPSSEINGLQYSIANGILTLNKLSDGISKILIIASTRFDNNFDEFYFRFGANALMAGFGKTYNFSSSAYLDTGNSAELNAMQKVSFSSWVKLNSVGREQGIAGKASSSNTGWYLILQNNNLLKFSVKTQDGITRKVYGLQALEANKWYHIDVVYDGKDLYIYINGQLDNMKTSYTASSALLADAGKSMTIGNAYGVSFDGLIDEAVLWDNAISISRIRQIMGDKPDISLPDLVSYWPMNEGYYASTEDMTGLNDGMFINNVLSYWQDSDAPMYFFMATNNVLNSYLIGDDYPDPVYNITQNPASGTVQLINTATGEFSYTPATDYTGLAEFKYTVTYGTVTTPEKTVLVSVKDSNSIDEVNSAPSSFELFQNYPNPFNPVTQIGFALTKSGNIKLRVYNISGQLVSELLNGTVEAGRHSVDFDGSKLNSGIYYYNLEAEGQDMTRKMLLVK